MVLAYISDFETIVVSLPSATNDELTHAFTFGLRHEIKTQVFLSKANSLNEAMTAALAAEEVKHSSG